MIFFIIQILREINFKGSKSEKSVILTNSVALNFGYFEILHFLKAESYQSNKIQNPKMAKTAFLELLDSPKLISRKI